MLSFANGISTLLETLRSEDRATRALRASGKPAANSLAGFDEFIKQV
jgi:hypothetical protein